MLARPAQPPYCLYRICMATLKLAALNGFQLLAIDSHVTADAICVIGHRFGLLSTDVHAVCGKSLVKTLL